MKSFLTNNKYPILILIVAALLRFWDLGKNPPSLNVDEVSNAYNAYSVLKTARDEYGNFLPLTFKSFGDYNLPLSVYTLVPSIWLFGLNEFSVRLPSAIMGTITVLLTYLLTLTLFNNKKTAFLSSLLLAISPWHLQFSRYDHEANFMVFFTVLALTILLNGFKNFNLLIISFVSFGLALITYHGAKIWVPIILIVTIYWYRREILKYRAKILWLIAIMILFSLPILLNFKNSLIRGQSVGVFGKPQALESFVSGYLAHYNPNFLFVSGDSIGRHAVSGMGELYVFEAPLIILGLLYLVRRKNKNSKFLLTWLLVAGIPPATATPTPHALRGLSFIPVWSIIAACGLNSFLMSKISQGVKKIGIVTILFLASYNLVTYLHLYYKHYPKERALDWGDGYKEMINFVDSQKENFSKIAISNYYGHPYIYVLFYTKYDPSIYQSQAKDKTKFDKFEFFGESWSKDTTGKVLMVRPAWQIPNPAPKYLKFVYAQNGDLIFRISEE